MRLILIAFLILFISGCRTKPDVALYLQYNKATGVANGYFEKNGKKTGILIEPEFTQMLGKKNGK